MWKWNAKVWWQTLIPSITVLHNTTVREAQQYHTKCFSLVIMHTISRFFTINTTVICKKWRSEYRLGFICKGTTLTCSANFNLVFCQPNFWHSNKSSSVAEMGDRLATTDMGQKLGEEAVPLWGLGRRLPPYQVASSSIQPSDHNRHGQKWGLSPFWGGGTGSPSNTMWPGLRPTSTTSLISINPIGWPQYTNVTDRTDRQWSDSIGRTGLQTIAQKSTSKQHWKILWLQVKKKSRE